MRDLWETIKYMIRKECERNSLADLCEHWDVSIDDFYTFLNAADRAEAEVERYKLMVKSITGGLDEAIETNQYLEAELAKYKRAYAEICHQFNFGDEGDYRAMYDYWLDWAEKEGER